MFKNLLEGAVLVMIVLYLFLGNLRAAAIVASIIPLALLSTFMGLRLRGLPGEPALAGRHGLRHHRGRRGDRAGKYLPRAFRTPARERRNKSAATSRM